jgi:hypothetical protein
MGVRYVLLRLLLALLLGNGVAIAGPRQNNNTSDGNNTIPIRPWHD